MRILSRLRWAMLGLLVAGVIVTPRPAYSDGPSASASADKQDPKGEIEQIEKQIQELQKKLLEMKEPAKQAPESVSLPAGTLPSAVMDQFKWRSIGPANMGGRVTALAIYEPDPSIYYVATASGGLVKTTNNGTTFTHQFDNQTTVSIGDVAVCQTNPDIVWVGTGEANPRNSASYGDGVYKSTDGGKTWTNMGLNRSFQIGKVLIHPKNPDIVYVGALGRLYGPNEERGLYKTTDGGKTWTRVLYVDDKTGVIDARLDPKDPETLIVAMWERKRDEFDGFFGTPPVPDSYGPIVTHGPGGGLFKSTDGGKSWKKLNDAKLANGLPTVKTGRIGLDYSSKTKGLLFAIIDTEKVGTGDPPVQTYMGVIGENAEGGGAKLNEITADGPADKSGFKAGDIVIKSGDDKIESYEQLVELVRSKRPNDKLKLTVKRDGKEQVIELTIGARPQTEAASGRGGSGGARTRPGQPTAGRPTLGVTFAQNSLKLGSVIEGRPAAEAGLKVDDEITAIDGKAVKTLQELQQAIGEKKAGDKIKLTVTRGDKKDVAVELTLGAPAVAGAQPTTTGVLMPGIAPEINFQAEEVKVGTVAKGSDAEKAGVKVGDKIVQVDGKDIGSFRDFITALRTSTREDNPRKAGDKVKVKVQQGEKTIEGEFALAEMQIEGMRGGGGVARGASSTRPYGMGLGGQVANAQDKQGKDGYQTGGIYMSKDNGDTWTRVNSLNARPMYFSVIRVDPSNDNTLYVLCDTPSPIYRSTDGGKTFTNMSTARGVHADAHALWINPKNSQHLIIGCDGGFYVTFDTGATWEHLNHLALGQFYHVAIDNRRPYKVYGGLQDNGSWGGVSNSRRSYGPVNEDWVYVSGGDGFVCRVDPTDPDLVYTESQGGNVSRRNFRTGERGSIRPPQRTGEPPHRFNWNTPFILSSHNPSIFYNASQFVWRSVKKGTDLRKISPEITRTPAGSGTALSESPINQDVLWAGTDDGYLWVTRDGGANWTNVSDNLKEAGLPGYRWIATIEASRDKEGRCYVCVDAHRSDDDKPYLFVTEDFGKTWKSIASNLPAFGSTRCLREDLKAPDVLYCGTEFGAWVSINRGASWSKLGAGLPTVAVHEFAQEQTPRGSMAGDIVAATHGRSIWVLDATSIRQMKADALKESATLFAPAPLVRWRSSEGAESPYSRTNKKFVGENPSRGTSIDYYLGKPAEKVSLKIIDVNGRTVRDLSSNEAERKAVGLHRITWDGTQGSGGIRGAGGRGGQRSVPAGTYRIVLTVDDKESSDLVVVENDPNLSPDFIGIAEEIEVPGEEEEEDQPNPLDLLRRLLKNDD